MKWYSKILSLLLFIIIASSFSVAKINCGNRETIFVNDSIKTDSVYLDSLVVDCYKENVHASYYHDKFNGRKTANGEKFNNNLYTAAHKKLKFGTKLRVTNTVNGKSVIVTVNDRGPFVKGREIDLSKKAFMEIAKYKQRGYLIVNLEIIE